MKGVPVQSQLAMLAELQGFSAAAARAEAARVLQLVLLARRGEEDARDS